MALTKEQKKNIIEKIKENLENQKILLFVGISGLKAGHMLDLRKELKENNCLLNVVKKTLLKIAVKEKKIDIDVNKLESELALVYGFSDEISAAKAVDKFSKGNENLKILGGFFKNELIDENKVIALAEIPSREELLAKLVGSLNSPVAGFVNALQGNVRNLIYIFKQIKA